MGKQPGTSYIEDDCKINTGIQKKEKLLGRMGEIEGIMRGDEKKKDHGKPMWDLLPYRQVAQIVDILTFGASKYGPNQWQAVENPGDRYFAALMRHLTAWKEGEEIDEESGKSHLSHAGCCLLFLMWFDDNKP